MCESTKLLESRSSALLSATVPLELLALCNTPQIGSLDAVFLKAVPLKPRIHLTAPYRYVPQVPQEIIDLIVDNIEDVPSFHACSLVCWAFVPSCRKRIFRDICFGMFSDAPKKLYEILLRSPSIALYIKDVTIHRPQEPNFWIEPGSPLPAVLSMLSHINRFSLFGCWGDWLDIPPALASAFMRVISLESLDRLHVLTVANVPAAFLRHALSVRIVSLFYVDLDPTEKLLHLPPPTRSSAYPEYLNLSLDSKVGRILESMQTSGSDYFSNVRGLAVNPIPNSISSAQNFTRVLSAVENTVERLDIQWHEHYIAQLTCPRASHLRHLRTLQLHIIMQTPGHTLPQYLPSHLAKLQHSNPLLSSLTLHFHVPVASVIPVSSESISSVSDSVSKSGLGIPSGGQIPHAADTARLLRTLDGVLAGFSALQTLHMRVTPECSPPSVVPDYAAFLKENLSAVGRKGILSVKQGYRARGAAVMPLLPYVEVWPHRKE
ncbi:Glyceraldehyde-3-phosphate dehydrogenase [Mycena sanguinolenta]|uniref:Glyceraldehyde-3-phosphate dehydrogenase n=1 Tax=Mycena sanguinolenta TaxID=230812 RepID=A0A8H6ZHP6_9AGAR|nr:Glyceraldehyde-3-phosphate dehydrogenase [Mycena sanguinolenta]